MKDHVSQDAPTAHTPAGPHLPAGSAASGPYALDVTPGQDAALRHAALRVLELPAGGTHTFATGDSEWIVLPLSGGCVIEVDADEEDRTARTARPGGERAGAPTEGQRFDVRGRASVFGAVSDFVYLPRDAHTQISSGAGGRFALAGAKCERRLPARYGPAPEVPVELRGTGMCSRQVNNFAAAGVFPCDRLIAVEVLTPGGNWSSYPPHKHDEHRPGVESELEEIYYYEIAEGPGGAPGLGYQRVSPSRQGGTELLTEVRDGDTVLIPDGWHGPAMASPGHAMYYLNVMAGPAEERAWLISDHPDHGWIRDTWPFRPTDPRLPLYTAPVPTPPGPAGPGSGPEEIAS
ncbi:5-deoxy-glucuronate isomerase [Streptomyces tsukubensis]|uniref:5-deoxy-glucuronate isomerase n=1 Tax=Streptomyces tsukubensis TaxID=83656 RepID=A0A1V4A1W0_9ACTN|nr:5-deoxy-glucuronate isomerase [Streptomyces tsukubensis]OON72516.1 5-deoxy-glucuronate isomerase [Streptomyces tsukubensis]QFR93639.1 5-deoxy-glucuronate isomerase [Streptomyces tsukubensis]